MDEDVHERIIPLLNDTLSVIRDKAIECAEYARRYPNTTEFVSVLFFAYVRYSTCVITPSHQAAVPDGFIHSVKEGLQKMFDTLLTN